MFEEIDRIAANLKNRDEGWVTRRDAADQLGDIALRSLQHLRAHEDDDDRDVQAEVKRSLGQASRALQGVAPAGPAKTPDLNTMIRALERPGRREVRVEGKGFNVHVTLQNGRTQDVAVVPHERKDGIKLVRVYTKCGAPSPDSYRWALQSNLKLAQCALALTKENGEEMYVMSTSFLDGELTEFELKAAVKEVAFYGDWIEEKMTGLDEF